MKNNKGMGLLVVMVLLTLLSLMTYAAGYSIIKHGQDASKGDLGNRSRYVARAGLEAVMNELGHSDTYVGNSSGNRHVDSIYGSSNLAYEVFITNNSAGATPITAPDGRSVDPGSVYLTSVGKETVSGTQVSVAAMAGVAYKTRPNFNHAAYADGYLTVINSKIDAWESANGSYSPRSGAFSSTPPPDRKGSLGGFAGSPNTIVLQGATKLDGQVSEGPGAAAADPMLPHTTIATAATVAVTPNIASDAYGTKIPKFDAPYHPSSVGSGLTIAPPPPPPPPLPALPPSPVTVSPGAYQFMNIKPGMTVILKSGIYYFEDYLALDNANIELNLNGSGDPAVVFIGKEARVLNGSKVNEYGETHELQLCFTDAIVQTSSASFEADLTTMMPAADASLVAASRFTPTTTQVEYSKLKINDSKVVGAIAGQGLEANILLSEVYGAIMGQDIRMKDTDFHQDLSLKGASLTSGGDWNLGGVHDISL